MSYKGERVLSEKRVITYITFVFLSLVFSASIRAVNYIENEKLDISKIPLLSESRDITNANDSVIYYTRGANGLIVMPPSDWEPFPYNVKFRDTVIYNPAYLPIVFDGKVLPSNLDFIPKDTLLQDKDPFRLIPREETFSPRLDQMRKIENLRRDYYMNMNNVRNIKYSVSKLKQAPQIDEEGATKRNILNELITPEEPVQVAPVTLPKSAPEYIYWIKRGEHSLQASQNFISDNWHSGGNSNYAVRSYQKFTLNYKKDKISFDNLLEWKLSLQKVLHVEKNGTNISEDMFRMVNAFGIQAFNKWSYSATLETLTPLFSSKPVNSDVKNTALFSPLVMNLGLGMSYKLNKQFASDKAKKLELNQTISPLALNYVYVNDLDINDSKKQGVEEGEHSKLTIGSTINTDLKFNINRYLTWNSRFKYFTDYSRAVMEFENRFVMELNRYLSTTFFLYLRYDDESPSMKGERGYLQINQMLSFGLSYKW